MRDVPQALAAVIFEKKNNGGGVLAKIIPPSF
jgi:hypothetical protein